MLYMADIEKRRKITPKMTLQKEMHQVFERFFVIPGEKNNRSQNDADI